MRALVKCACPPVHSHVWKRLSLLAASLVSASSASWRRSRERLVSSLREMVARERFSEGGPRLGKTD